MIKKKVLSQDSEEFETCKERVIIRHDDSYCFDRDESERPFRLWVTNTREYASDRDAVCPVREEEREDGTYLVNKDGFLVFKVSAYIHSGRVWALGNGENFPDFMWDVSPMGYLYTTRELWERCMGEGTWLKPSPNDPTMTFNKWAQSLAKSEIEEMNLAESGHVYWYETEKRVDFKRVYQDGHEVEDHEWEDGDSCGGFLTDNVDGIDFPRDPNIPVFAVGDGATHLVGDEYTIPEFIVRRKNCTHRTWEYLRSDGLFDTDPKIAKVFYSHHAAQAAYRVTIDPNPTDPSVVYHHIIEKDDVRPPEPEMEISWVVERDDGMYFEGNHGSEKELHWCTAPMQALSWVSESDAKKVAESLRIRGFAIKLTKVTRAKEQPNG